MTNTNDPYVVRRLLTRVAGSNPTFDEALSKIERAKRGGLITEAEAKALVGELRGRLLENLDPKAQAQ